ncbi:MAG: hypothetical protein ACRDNL_20230, partial [Spirillospora sp.]
ALATFWMILGDHAEAARRLRLALEAPRREDRPVPDDAEAVALGGYLFNTVMAGGDARDDPFIGVTGRDSEHPLAAMIEPAIALLTGDTARGVAAIDRRLPERDPWTRAALHLMRAMLNGNQGEMDAAHQDLAVAEAAFREAGERVGLSLALVFLADTQTVRGEFDEAVAGLEESIALLRGLGQGDNTGMQRVMLAVARARSGDTRRARDELTAMIVPGAGTQARYLVSVRLALGDLARHAGDVDEAHEHYDAAERETQRVPSYLQYRSLLEAARGQLAIGRDDPDAARRHLRTALDLAIDGPDIPIAAVTGFAVARLRASADPARAAEVLGASSVLRGAPDAFNPDVALVTRDLRRALGERTYRDAHARGARLDVPAALALVKDQLRRR